jgi:phenylpyruvate tautomerase PptA (4-oxalocrotonate tautomerase family)
MPLYSITTQAGALSRAGKAKLAADLTTLHAEYAPGSGFTAGEVSATAALTLLIRTGRSPDYKRGLLKRLWELFKDATGAPDDQIVIGIQELLPSQAMEMAQIMPEVAGQ